MKPVKIGTVLYENEETTAIYEKYRAYFMVDEKNWYVKYIISKEPSEELIKDIENYYAAEKERNKKHDEFVDYVAKDVFSNLSQEDKEYINFHPDSTEHHFGMGLAIRNKYIHGKDLDFFIIHPDDLSSEITSRIASLVIDNYDYENPYYRYLYNSSTFTDLRRLYYAVKGEFPDDIIDQFADDPDEYEASKKAEGIIRASILDLKRFKRLCKKYGISDDEYKECKSFVAEYNKRNRAVIPYDICLLTGDTLEIEFRNQLLRLMKAVFEQSPRVALEMPGCIFNKKDTVLLAVEAMGKSLERFKQFNADDDVIRTALKDNGEAIQYVKKSLRDNPEYIRLAVSNYSFMNGLSTRCMAKYRDNDDIVKLALEADGYNMCHASKRLKDDYDMAMFAIKNQSGNQGPGVVHYLSPRLRDNIDIAMADIKVGQAEIDSYSTRLRDSKEVAEALLATDNAWKLYQMSKRIRQKYDEED